MIEQDNKAERAVFARIEKCMHVATYGKEGNPVFEDWREKTKAMNLRMAEFFRDLAVLEGQINRATTAYK